MSEAELFRQYAKEAMRESSEVASDDEKRSLIDLACIWVQAAHDEREGVRVELYFVAA
jgi:hypothetical protein